MSPFRMGFKIWGITVFLNAVYLSFVGLIMSSGYNIMLSFIVLFGGVFVGLPFLFLLVQLIRLVRRLPYSIAARICLIFFWVSVGIWLFYSAISWVLDGKVDAEARLLAGTTIAAFLTSMWRSRKSFHEVDGMNEYSIN